MREQISSWLAPSAQDPELARRQYLLNMVLLGLAGPGFLFGLVMAVMYALGRAPITGALAGFGVQPFYLLAYWLGRRGRVRLAAYVPVTAIFLVMSGGSYQMGIGHVTLIGYAMVTLTAGILIGNGAALLFTLLSVVAHVIVGMAQMAGSLPDAFPPEATVFADAAGLGLGLVVLVVFNWFSTREMSRALQHERELSVELQTQRATLEQQVAERTQELARRATQLETAAEVAREAAAIRDMDELLDETARLVSDRFGLYHVGIFLVDDAREYAVLQAASSGRGERTVTKGFQLKIGAQGIVGHTAQSGQPYIVPDVKREPFYFAHPDLPETRSEMTLPLRVRGETIGVLDVQSTEPGAFSDGDVATLGTMADQLAVAIENARLFEQTQASLREVKALYRGYSKEAWGELIRAGRVHGYTYDQVSVFPVTADRPPEVQQALREGRAVTVSGGDGGGSETVLAVPVRVRGEAIGVLDIRKAEGAGEWTSEEMLLAKRVSDQLALALENARLLEDSRRRAEREQLVGQMTAQFTRSLDMEAVLRTAARELGQLPQVAEVSVHVIAPEASPAASEREEA